MPGDGSVYRRKSDGRWVAALSIGSRDDRVIQRRYAHTRAEARNLLAELIDQPTPATMTVGTFLDQWVTEARNIRPTTRRGYRAVVTYHLKPTIGHIRLAELTPAHVETMLADLTGAMSPKSLRNVHAVLRRALGQAVRADLIPRNVAAREFVDTPRVTVDEPRALTTAEVGRFLEACRGDRLEAVFVVALGTGLRQGEILGLAWEDITPDALHVRKELVHYVGIYEQRGRRRVTLTRPRDVREDPKTPRSKRIVPLAQPVAVALDEHRGRVIAAGFIPTATGPVFTNLDGGALSGSWLTHHFYDLLAAAGIERLPFKNLRTTFASRLDEAGVSELTVATLLGHARTHTTRKHYISQTPESAVAAIAKLVG